MESDNFFIRSSAAFVSHKNMTSGFWTLIVARSARAVEVLQIPQQFHLRILMALKGAWPSRPLKWVNSCLRSPPRKSTHGSPFQDAHSSSNLQIGASN